MLTELVRLFEPNTELEPLGLYVFSTDEPDPGVEPGVVDVGLYAGRELYIKEERFIWWFIYATMKIYIDSLKVEFHLDVDDDDDVADVADVG